MAHSPCSPTLLDILMSDVSDGLHSATENVTIKFIFHILFSSVSVSRYSFHILLSLLNLTGKFVQVMIMTLVMVNWYRLCFIYPPYELYFEWATGQYFAGH